jgi:hypothetical protein
MPGAKELSIVVANYPRELHKGINNSLSITFRPHNPDDLLDPNDRYSWRAFSVSASLVDLTLEHRSPIQSWFYETGKPSNNWGDMTYLRRAVEHQTIVEKQLIRALLEVRANHEKPQSHEFYLKSWQEGEAKYQDRLTQLSTNIVKGKQAAEEFITAGRLLERFTPEARVHDIAQQVRALGGFVDSFVEKYSPEEEV